MSTEATLHQLYTLNTRAIDSRAPDRRQCPPSEQLIERRRIIIIMKARGVV